MAIGTVHGQRQGAVRAGGDGQLGVAIGGVGNSRGVQAVVDDGLVAGFAVDLQCQGIHVDGQALDAFDGGALHGGLHAGPLTGGDLGGDLGRGELLAHERDAQAHAGELNAHAIGTDKGREVAATDEQHVHIHQSFVGWRGWVVLNASELDLALLALDAKAALDGDKVKDVDLKVAGQAGELAIGTVHGQRQGAVTLARACGDVEVFCLKIDQSVVCGLAIQREF